MFELLSTELVVETVIRTLLVFLFTFALMRLRGIKQLAHLNMFDVLIIIALGSSVGDVMIYSETEVPMYRSLVAIATVIVLVLVIENLMAVASKRVINLIEGKEEVLMRNGVTDFNMLKRVNINEEELKMMLKSKGIVHASEVKLAALEPNGEITIIRKHHKRKKQFLLKEF